MDEGLGQNRENTFPKSTHTGREPCRVNTFNDSHLSDLTEWALHLYFGLRYVVCVSGCESDFFMVCLHSSIKSVWDKGCLLDFFLMHPGLHVFL